MKVPPAALAAVLAIVAGCQPATTPPAPGTAPSPSAGPTARLAPAAFDPPKPGTIIVGHRADGSLEKTRVLAVQGHTVTLLEDGQRVTRYPFCYGCADPLHGTVEMARYASLWPLEVGKSVTFQSRRTGDGAVRVHIVTVARSRTVQTEFGPFDAFVVKEEVRGAGENRWHGTRTQWYAPKLHWAVKSTWQSSDGQSGSWEIAAIALAQ